MATEKAPPNAGPKARALAAKLRKHILTHCQANDRLQPEDALAVEHRCSTTTVRAALGLLVAEGLIFRRQGSGTYVRERTPSGTATTELIYFGTPRNLLLTPWARDAYLGVLSAASVAGRGVNLTMAAAPSPAKVRLNMIRKIDPDWADSAICLEVFNHALLTELAERVPVVSIDFPCFQPGVSSGYLDHGQNLDALVEHLWRLGHRRIALAGNIRARHTDPAAAARCVAFRKALAGRGLSFSARWILPFGNASGAVEAVRTWKSAASGERPTAVICVNYHWLLAQAAVCLDLSIPEDLSLVAMGDEGPWVENASTRSRKTDDAMDVQQVLTGEPTDFMAASLTVLRNMQVCQARLPFERMGRWAMEEALRRLEHPDATPEHESFTCTIEPGNSVASPVT